MREALKVWLRNEKKIEEAIINGEKVEAVESDFGANEFVIDFLKETGFWDIITGMKPKMGKNNGYSSDIILGALIMKELLAIGKLSGAGKILEDGKLMADTGFNIEKIKKAEEKEKGVIDLGTLRNHLKKIPQDESDRAFYKHIRFLREKRWIRGHQYVADAVELEVPYGETFEGMGEVWDKREKRYKYGYKLELLMNVTTTGRLRFVGAALGPINSGERALLAHIFKDIEKYLGKGKVDEIIDSLTLDRGYWGGHFLWELKHRWGVDFVTLARDDDLDFVKHVEYYLRGVEPTFKERWITVKKRGKKEKKKIRICGINGLYLRRYSKEGKEKDLGKVNTVIVYDEHNGRERRRIYVTTLNAEDDPFKIYKLYKDRWTIENQGIRYLSQRWNLRDLAGRSLNSIQARIWIILMLYNAMKILEMKYENKMEKLKDKMREKGERSYLSGCALIVYGRDKYYGIFSGVNYANLIAERTARTVAKATASSTAQEIAEELEKMLVEKASKKKIAEFIKRLRKE
ncbi:MAG: transposase [Candidatus Aerophobetes bacterium]|nr:transposase [Candidatus Aerophobetes bacterium]